MQLSRRRPRSVGLNSTRRKGTGATRKISRRKFNKHGHAYEVLNLYTGTALDPESIKAFTAVTRKANKSKKKRRENIANTTALSTRRVRQSSAQGLVQDPYRLILNEDVIHLDNIRGMDFGDALADHEAYLAACDIQKVFRGHLHRRKARFIKSLWADMEVVLHDSPIAPKSPGFGKLNFSMPVVKKTTTGKNRKKQLSSHKSPSKIVQSPEFNQGSRSRQLRESFSNRNVHKSDMDVGIETSSLGDASGVYVLNTARTLPNPTRPDGKQVNSAKLRGKISPPKKLKKHRKQMKQLKAEKLEQHQKRTLSGRHIFANETSLNAKSESKGDEAIQVERCSRESKTEKGMPQSPQLSTTLIKTGSFVDRRIGQIDEKIQKLSDLSNKLEIQFQQRANSLNVRQQVSQTEVKSSSLVPQISTKDLNSPKSEALNTSRSKTSSKRKKEKNGAKLAVKALLSTEFKAKRKTKTTSSFNRPNTSREWKTKLSTTTNTTTDHTPRTRQIALRLGELEAKLERHVKLSCNREQNLVSTEKHDPEMPAIPTTTRTTNSSKSSKEPPKSARLFKSNQDCECTVPLFKRTASAKNVHEYQSYRPVKGKQRFRKKLKSSPDEQREDNNRQVEERSEHISIEEGKQSSDPAIGEGTQDETTGVEAGTQNGSNEMWAFPSFQQCPDLQEMVAGLDELNDHLLHRFGQVEEVPLDDQAVEQFSTAQSPKNQSGLSTTSMMLLRQYLEQEISELHTAKAKERATTSIQRCLRGHNVRQGQNRRVVSSIKIQRVYRGFRGRESTRSPIAARKIQKCFRGSLGRKEVKRQVAARAIQRRYRLHSWNQYYAEQEAWDRAYRAMEQAEGIKPQSAESAEAVDERVEQEGWSGETGQLQAHDPAESENIGNNQEEADEYVEFTETAVTYQSQPGGYTGGEQPLGQGEYVQEITQTVTYGADDWGPVPPAAQEWGTDPSALLADTTAAPADQEAQSAPQDIQPAQSAPQDIQPAQSAPQDIQPAQSAPQDFQPALAAEPDQPAEAAQVVSQSIPEAISALQREAQNAQAAAHADTVAAALAAANAAVEALRAATLAAESTARSNGSLPFGNSLLSGGGNSLLSNGSKSLPSGGGTSMQSRANKSVLSGGSKSSTPSTTGGLNRPPSLYSFSGYPARDPWQDAGYLAFQGAPQDAGYLAFQGAPQDAGYLAFQGSQASQARFAAQNASSGAAMASMAAVEAVEEAEAASAIAEHARAEQQAAEYRELIARGKGGRRGSLMDKTESRKAEMFFELAMAPPKQESKASFFELPPDERPEVPPAAVQMALERGQSELPVAMQFHPQQSEPAQEWDQKAYMDYYGPYAATTIQRMFRGHLTRHSVYRPHVCARAIQRAYRLFAWSQYNKRVSIPLTPSRATAGFWNEQQQPQVKQRRASQDYLNMLNDFWKSPNSHSSGSPGQPGSNGSRHERSKSESFPTLKSDWDTQAAPIEPAKEDSSQDAASTPMGRLNAPRKTMGTLENVKELTEAEERDDSQHYARLLSKLPSRLDYVDIQQSEQVAGVGAPTGVPSIDVGKAQTMKLQVQDSLFNVLDSFPDSTENQEPESSQTAANASYKVSKPMKNLKNESSQIPTDAIQATVEPSEVPAETFEVPAEPAEVPAETAEVPAEPAEVPAEIAEVPAEPAQATTEQVQTTNELSQVVQPDQPFAKPVEPAQGNRSGNNKDTGPKRRPADIAGDQLSAKGYICLSVASKTVQEQLKGQTVQVVRSDGTFDECVLIDFPSPSKVRCRRVRDSQVFVKKDRFCWFKL